MRIYWLDIFEKGNIGMMARPKGGEWLESEIQFLKTQNIDTVVSLLEIDEMHELEIDKEEKYCNELQIDFINSPIKDMNLPNKSTYLKLISEIDKRVKDGQKIVIHCRMGIGRTSMVTAGVLIKNEIQSNNIFEFISRKRTLSVPDTDAQKNWIYEMIPEISNL